jgi:vitamin B12 transporter
MQTVFAGGRAPRMFLCPFAVAGFASLASLTAAPVSAQTELPPVVITATRTATRIDQTVAETTIITREQIERAPGRTLSELLASQPGIQFTSNGGMGKNSSVSIRGMDTRHTLLLIDGVRFGAATAGSPLLESLSLDMVERIEIVRGPLSSLYGSDAVGGVVQVFTRQGRQGLRPNASVTVGSQRFAKATGGAAFGDGPFSGAVQVAHLETRGFSATNENVPFGNHNPDRDGYRQDSGVARLGYRLSEAWQAGVSLLSSDSRSPYDDGPGADTLGTVRSELAGADLTGRLASNWQTVTRVARTADRASTVASASPYTGLGAIVNVQEQFSHEHSIDSAWGTWLLLADHVKQKVSKPVQQYDVTLRSINGLAVGLNGHAQGHTWQASLRRDSNSQYGDQETGSVAYAYAIAPAWRVGASYGTSFVSPSFNQLYWPGYGNPNLLPEEGKSGELNLRYTQGVDQFRATVFDNRVRGYITAGPAPTNIPRTRIRGLSLSHETRLAGWDVTTSYDHLDPRNLTPGANYGKLLQRRARNALKASADGDVGPVRAGFTLAAFSDRYENANNTTRLGGYGTLDLRAGWRFEPDWTLGLAINNVGDKRYETALGYNQPRREAYLSLRYAPQ